MKPLILLIARVGDLLRDVYLRERYVGCGLTRADFRAHKAAVRAGRASALMTAEERAALRQRVGAGEFNLYEEWRQAIAERQRQKPLYSR